jgi:hypothetical protein
MNRPDRVAISEAGGLLHRRDYVSYSCWRS